MFVHSAPFYVIIVLVISYFVPLVSARLVTPTSDPALAGILTTVFAILTALGGELAHAVTSAADFSWGLWASQALVAVVVAMPIAHSKVWSGSNAETKLVTAGSKSA